jgi:hypothetical protein
MSRHPLPDDVLILIRIAAGSSEALDQATAATGKDPAFVRAAAIFYLQQVLWARGSDSYRALGAPPESGQKELAEHVRWLMKWLHPDRGASEVNKIYADRVLKAWDKLKTPERRRSYDRSLTSGRLPRSRATRSLSANPPRTPWIPSKDVGGSLLNSRPNRTVAFLALLAATTVVAAFVLLAPGWILQQ